MLVLVFLDYLSLFHVLLELNLLVFFLATLKGLFQPVFLALSVPSLAFVVVANFMAHENGYRKANQETPRARHAE